MTDPLRISQLFVSDETTPGTEKALAATDAIKLTRDGVFPTRANMPQDRQIVHARADYGGAAQAAANYFQGSLPPILMGYPCTAGAIDADGTLKDLKFFTAAGYVKNVISTTSTRLSTPADPNVDGSGLAALTMRFQAGPDGAGGPELELYGARGQLEFYGADGPLPHRFALVNYMGAMVAANELVALSSPTYNNDPHVQTPLNIQIVETDLNDNTVEETYDGDTGLVISSWKIVSPYPVQARPAHLPGGFYFPPYMAPGMVQLEMLVDAQAESDLPIETWIDSATTRRLRVRFQYDDSSGLGGALRHIVRGCWVSARAWEPGPPLRQRLTLMGSANPAGTLPAHEFEFAAAIADLSAPSDDPA